MPICAQHGQSLVSFSADFRLEEYDRCTKISFKDVVMHELIVQSQMTRLDIDRENRARIQIAARAPISSIGRYGIAGREIRQPELEIHRWVRPNATAAELPSIIERWPSLASGLTGGRHREHLPDLLSCSRFQSREPSS